MICLCYFKLQWEKKNWISPKQVRVFVNHNILTKCTNHKEHCPFSSCCQIGCLHFIVSQLPAKSIGIMYRMHCTLHDLILHTTSLIPIAMHIIPHLQSQIIPQSSLLFSRQYSLSNITKIGKNIIMQEKLQTHGNKATIYYIYIHTLSCMFCMLCAEA